MLSKLVKWIKENEPLIVAIINLITALILLDKAVY